MKKRVVFSFIIILFLFLCRNIDCADDWNFPKDFFVGSASSAYQIEGGWNASGKGESYWDFLTNNQSWNIADGRNGNIAANSLHKYKEDVAILKDIGFDFYRFSISWSRIFPNGFANKISKEGIKYYNNLLDELQAKGLEPFVTLFHHDYPVIFEELGGLSNELIVEWFADFARIVFQELGHKIKYFVTINEPNLICSLPAFNRSLYEQYLCTHNLIKAHARVYHMYHDEFRPTQNGKIGILLICGHFFPEFPNDTLTPDIAFQYDCGTVAHPIFSQEGDYPKVIRDRIDENSKIEGWPRSKLPKFSRQEIKYIRGTSDYFGLNHYTSFIVKPVEKIDGLGWINDKGFNTTEDPKRPKTAIPTFRVVPEGFSGTLRKIRDQYGNPQVYVLENGFSDYGNVTDYERLSYHYSYLKEMLLAIKDDCDVKAYTIWSLLDSFEWFFGYTIRFGIVHVDFNDPERKRTYKTSAKWFKDVLRNRKLIPIDDYVQ